MVGVRRVADGYNLTVTDNGTGIADEHLPHLFDRFYRAEQSRSRTTGGSGLGLAITKHLVEAHGGRITVTSRPRLRLYLHDLDPGWLTRQAVAGRLGSRMCTRWRWGCRTSPSGRRRAGNPVYQVGGKSFVFFRTAAAGRVRPGHRRAVRRRDRDLGASEDDKLALVSDESNPFFTTPHFNGHPSVLVRASRLGELTQAGTHRGHPGRLALPSLQTPRHDLARRTPAQLSGPSYTNSASRWTACTFVMARTSASGMWASATSARTSCRRDRLGGSVWSLSIRENLVFDAGPELSGGHGELVTEDV